jgi:hypothetical protein
MNTISPQTSMLSFITGVLTCAVVWQHGMPTDFYALGYYVLYVLSLVVLILAVFVISLKACNLPVPPLLWSTACKIEKDEQFYE